MKTHSSYKRWLKEIEAQGAKERKAHGSDWYEPTPKEYRERAKIDRRYVPKPSKEDLLDVKINPWYNWTYPKETPKVYCVGCGKLIKTKEDKISHSWARLCKKCNDKYPAQYWSR